MHNYVVIFRFEDRPGPECRDSRKDAITYIESYKYSTKLFKNAYQVFTMQDLPNFRAAVTEKLNPDDKVVIVETNNLVGQNIPNI